VLGVQATKTRLRSKSKLKASRSVTFFKKNSIILIKFQNAAQSRKESSTHCSKRVRPSYVISYYQQNNLQSTVNALYFAASLDSRFSRNPLTRDIWESEGAISTICHDPNQSISHQSHDRLPCSSNNCVLRRKESKRRGLYVRQHL
jgi:hypothetical protein